MAWRGAGAGLSRRQVGPRPADLTRDRRIVEQAFTEGRILRTHILRPTWHFVPPATSGGCSRSARHAFTWPVALSIDSVSSTRDVLTKPRRHRARASRRELLDAGGAADDASNAPNSGPRSGWHVDDVRRADAVICSGPRRGNQFTYALLEERVPRAPTLGRDEGARRARPPVLHEPWPGDRARLRLVVWLDRPRRAQRHRDGRIGAGVGRRRRDNVLVLSARQDVRSSALTTFLLPNYDEFAIAYRDRESCRQSRAAQHRGAGHLRALAVRRWTACRTLEAPCAERPGRDRRAAVPPAHNTRNERARDIRGALRQIPRSPRPCESPVLSP